MLMSRLRSRIIISVTLTSGELHSTSRCKISQDINRYPCLMSMLWAVELTEPQKDPVSIIRGWLSNHKSWFYWAYSQRYLNSFLKH